MESSQFTDSQSQFESFEPLEVQGATCDTFRVKLYGKLHFLKRLKPEYANDIRYQEAFRKEFETGYRLEHPNLVRYVSQTRDGILMEYIDGETLTQRLAIQPEYFKNKKNTDKFVRQFLDVVGYLHSHQVLHLDLKPDNILLTRINDDLKLIDLGCCYTDTFTDTTGRTNRFAAPEQLSSHLRGEAGVEYDVRTDIYAIGRILELLPNHYIYNKVIARCTAPDKADRYQSIEEILHEINRRRPYSLYVAVSAFLVVALALTFTHQSTPQPDSVPAVQKPQKDSTVRQEVPPPPVVSPSEVIQAPAPRQQKDDITLMKEDIDKMIDQAYRTTVFCFCDSSFPSPSPSTGKAWADASTEFHNQTIQIGDQLVEKYPTISESIVRQEAESRFQFLISYVFNKMRANGENDKKR